MTKISENDFLNTLRENSGLFAQTAAAIRTKYGIEYSRQAVRDRALKHPEILDDIEEETLDIAEAALFKLMQSEDERIQIRAVEFYLKMKGRTRKYVDRQEIRMDEASEIDPDELDAMIEQMHDEYQRKKAWMDMQQAN